MGVATGCGCKEVYRFPHSTYPYSSCICSVLQQHPYFLLFKCFSFLFQYFFVITFYVLNIFFTQYKHTYRQLRASHGIHMKVAHTVLHEEAHTNVHFLSCAGLQLYERGVDLEVEGVRYIEMHLGPAGHASFKWQRSRTRRRSQCMPRRVRIRVPRLPRASNRVMAS